MQPSVLIVILNYVTYDLTLQVIENLQKNLEYDNYKIMVIDNFSPNESAKVLEKKKDEIGYIFFANKVNSGYAAGNNIGIRYSINYDFKYTLILNNDVELRDNDVLTKLVNIAESNDKIGCVGPKIYSFDGRPCAPYCRRQSFWNMTLGLFENKRYRSKFIDISREVYRVYGCCMLLRNKTMNDIDCMDERTFLYCEEDILAERLLEKRYVTYYDSSVSVTHNESTTMKRISSNKRRFQIIEKEKSRELYLKEYRKFNFIERYICHMVQRIIEYLR